MKIAHAVIVLFLFAIVPLYAATPEKEADAYLSGLLRKKSYPGFSILVSCDGKVLFNRSYGMADKKAKRPNKIDTSFRVGSITKQFTAAAILLLQERRKLKVTDSLTNYFPHICKPGSDDLFVEISKLGLDIVDLHDIVVNLIINH